MKKLRWSGKIGSERGENCAFAIHKSGGYGEDEKGRVNRYMKITNDLETED